VFLVPADNCDEVAGVRTDLTLVRVADLQDAIGALEAIDDGKPKDIPRCRR
jgi:PDZ domain-containing protein